MGSDFSLTHKSDYSLSDEHEHNNGCYTPSEIEGFNSTFSYFEGTQTWSTIKALTNRLVANANTYQEEPDKIPSISYNSKGDSDDKNAELNKTFCEVGEENNIRVYLNYISLLAKQLDLKHKYRIIMSSNSEGRISGITISYDIESHEGNPDTTIRIVMDWCGIDSEAKANKLKNEIK